MLFRKTPLTWIATFIAFAIFAFLVVPQPHASGQGNSGAGKATSTPTFDPLEGDSGDDLSPPTACISGGPTSGLAPLSVNFDSSCSGGNIVQYFWDLGNGATSEGPTASTTYYNPGTYTVSLTVCTPTFQCDSTSRTVTVNAPPPPTNTPPPPAPTACFNANPTSGNAPLHANFSNCSGGNVVYYSWNFGDGGTSESPNPSHTYQNPGTYTASLTVCSPNNQCDSTSRTITANAPPPPTSTPPPPVPTACFTAGPTSGIAPLYVDFDSSCSGGNIVQYFWDFGDGGTSESPVPSHTYQNIGTYTATLTVCSPNTQCDSATRTITVHDTPTACFTNSPISGYAPLEVSFNSACSSSNVATYEWNFDDGNTSTEPNPYHTYTQAGTYGPTLKVCSVSNICRTTFGVVVVSNPPVPTACFTAGPTSGYAPLTVNVDSSCSSASAVHYFWDFGNGATSEAPTASTTYSNHGTYTITLTVCNQINQCDDATDTITVWQLPAPTASFSYSPSNPNYDVPVTFTNTTTPTAHLTSCLWDFGDGTTLDSCGTSTQELNVVHTYNDVGTFLVTLRVTNLSGTDIAMMEIQVGSSPIVDFDWSPNPIIRNQPAIFIDMSITNGEEPEWYYWVFPGNYETEERDPIFIFDSIGQFDVRHDISVNGVRYSITKTITVEKEPTPIPDFNWNPDPVEPNVVTEFINLTDPNGANISNVKWVIWPGEDTVGEDYPFYEFQQTGIHTIIMSFDYWYDDPDDPQRASLIKAVDVVNIEAGFTFEPLIIEAGYSVTFLDTSTVAGSGIVEWEWDFGDGSASNEQNPIHTYDSIGDHTVTLTVTGTYGHSDSISGSITVIVPELSISVSENQGFETITEFTFSAEADPYYVQTEWDLGDGTLIENQLTISHTYDLLPGNPVYPVDYETYEVRFVAYGSTYPSNPDDASEYTVSIRLDVIPEPIITFDYWIETEPFDFYFDGNPTLNHEYGAGVDPESFVWDFGHPNGTRTGVSLNHTFPGYNPSDPEGYWVTLTVSTPRHSSITSAPVRVYLAPDPDMRFYMCETQLAWYIEGFDPNLTLNALEVIQTILNAQPPPMPNFQIPHHRAILVLKMIPAGNDNVLFPNTYESLVNYFNGSINYFALDEHSDLGSWYTPNGTHTSFTAGGFESWQLTLSLDIAATGVLAGSIIIADGGIELSVNVPYHHSFTGSSHCHGEYDQAWIQFDPIQLTIEELTAIQQQVSSDTWSAISELLTSEQLAGLNSQSSDASELFDTPQ